MVVLCGACALTHTHIIIIIILLIPEMCVPKCLHISNRYCDSMVTSSAALSDGGRSQMSQADAPRGRIFRQDSSCWYSKRLGVTFRNEKNHRSVGGLGILLRAEASRPSRCLTGAGAFRGPCSVLFLSPVCLGLSCLLVSPWHRWDSLSGESSPSLHF